MMGYSILMVVLIEQLILNRVAISVVNIAISRVIIKAHIEEW